MKNFKTALMLFSTISILMAGCKSTKSSVSKSKGSENIKNDISLQKTLSIDEKANHYFEKLKNGEYGIVINHAEYDTDKPIDKTTGKPPAKSETKTTVSVHEDIKQTKTTTVNKSGAALSELYDKSKENTEIELSEQSKTSRSLAHWQIVFMSLGFIAALWILKRFKVWERLS